MIVKRHRDKKLLPPTIVRRSAGATAVQASRAIVRRSQPPVVGARHAGQRRSLRVPRISLRSGRHYLRAAAAGIAIGAFAYGSWLLYQSPAFRVNHVAVEGNERTATDDIVRMSELLGESMFTADLADAQKVLYSFPLVSSIKVERDWPNTVRIVVEERQAWGTWEQAGVRYTIDRDGVVLGTQPPPEGLPHIRAAEQTTLAVGDRVSYQAVNGAAEIYEKLPRQLGTTVSEVAYLAGTGVQVTTASGQSALFGDGSSIAYKLSVWAALAAEAENRGISYATIDLRYGNRPVLY
jgi:cell division protein FtsQ